MTNEVVGIDQNFPAFDLESTHVIYSDVSLDVVDHALSGISLDTGKVAPIRFFVCAGHLGRSRQGVLARSKLLQVLSDPRDNELVEQLGDDYLDSMRFEAITNDKIVTALPSRFVRNLNLR